MLDHGAMMRVLQDIWCWPPEVRPQIRKQDGALVFSWEWVAGRRALERLKHLTFCDQMLAGIRRRVYFDCTDAELLAFLRLASQCARQCAPEGVTSESVAVALTPNGRLARVCFTHKLKQAPRMRTEDDAIREEQKLNEEEGIESEIEKPAGLMLEVADSAGGADDNDARSTDDL